MKQKTFERMDIREIIKFRPWFEIILYPFIWMVNTFVLKSKEVNRFIQNHKHLKGVDFMAAGADYLGYKVIIRHPENMIREGPVVVPANHPGGGDLCAIFKALQLLDRKDVKILVNPLVHFSPIKDMVIPIPKGKNEKKSVMAEKIDEAFQQGNVFPIFPAGRDSRMRNGSIQDDPWKGTFVAQAIRHNAPIVPIHISGKNSKWFYRIARMRKFLGISFNIEQFFLIRELFLAQEKEIIITIGKPIDSSIFGKPDREVTNNAAQIIREYVYILTYNPDADFNQFYFYKTKTNQI